MPTADAASSAPRYRFDRCELRPAEHLLLVGGEPVRIGGRAFDMLVALVERRDRVVGKRELMDLVWPKLVVEENNLQAQVVALRKLLGPAAIATVPGRGYRFTAAVDDGAVAAPAARPLPAPAEPARRHNLPRSVEALIGRDDEGAQLRALIALHRLVTVTGPGGVGKSRLVVEAAWAAVADFADGTWLVELASLADPAQVPSTVTAALGIDVAPPLDALAALSRQLGDRRALLVLDNCEHVIDAVAGAVEAMLAAAPNVRVLVSSQELLGVAGEHVFRLPSLAVPAEPNPTAAAALGHGAVQLFVARAQAADPRFAFDDRAAAAVVAICRRLDGIPLALEMAASRVPMLGIEGLAGRLDERFRVLTAGHRTALPRQRTLHATLDWSYGLLSPGEQAVLRRLGVFAGSFALDAAEAVGGGAADDGGGAIESLAGLCDKSLVAADPGDGEMRYRLLETTRAYALERLAEAGETAAAMRRHALFYRRHFAACFDDWTRLSDADFRRRHAREIDQLRSATAWALSLQGDAETAMALVGSSVQAWLSLSLYAEADVLAEQALQRIEPATPAALQADLWLAVAALLGQRNQQATVRAARRAAELYRGLGDSLRLGVALLALGGAWAAEADARAEPVLLEARPLLEGSGRPRLRALSHSGFALFHGAVGRPEQASVEAQAALELWRAAGAEGAALRTLGALADQVWQQGELERAIGLARDAIERQRQSPFAGRMSLTYATANLFGMLVEHGDLAEAQAIGGTVLAELRELGIAHGWSDHFGARLARTGRHQAAVRLVGWADTLRLARELKRQPNEQRARETILALARECDPAADLDRLLAEGAALSEHEALRLAWP